MVKYQLKKNPNFSKNQSFSCPTEVEKSIHIGHGAMTYVYMFNYSVYTEPVCMNHRTTPQG